MTLSPKSRLTVANNVLSRELDDEIVILNLDNETYYGLDAVGTRIWATVIAAQSLGEAIDELLEEFDIDRETLTRDVDDLILQLAEQGLVEVVNE